MNNKTRTLMLVLMLLSTLLLAPLVASARLIGGEVALVHLNFHEAYPGGVGLGTRFIVTWLEKSDFNYY
ncbi:MAG: hypothetical protein KKA73_14520, partial [Chloroflexi bacterium]|nr:hypothetical protein [Chloroflexota bacterium]